MALGALNAPNATLGALDAPNATLGRIATTPPARRVHRPRRRVRDLTRQEETETLVPQAKAPAQQCRGLW
ncbi:hypothetical protein GCM10023192_66190 [Amycolatopsis samaneae]